MPFQCYVSRLDVLEPSSLDPRTGCACVTSRLKTNLMGARPSMLSQIVVSTNQGATHNTQHTKFSPLPLLSVLVTTPARARARYPPATRASKMSFDAEARAARRVHALARHVSPIEASSSASTMAMAPSPTAAAVSSTTTRTYASATGTPTSYERVHGEVSREPVRWTAATVEHGALTEVIYEKGEGIARVTINRPEKRNAFTPRTVKEMQWCFDDARDDTAVGVVVLTGKGDLAFCSGGDQSVRGVGGYVDAAADKNIPRLNVLDLQMQIRRMPKPVVAQVAGYAIGGGHILHMICDLTIAADNAVFGQTGPKVGSFDAGYGSTHMARLVGQKKAREMWFLARTYDAAEAHRMGLVNTVVPLRDLEVTTNVWCREMLRNSPTALRLCKVRVRSRVPCVCRAVHPTVSCARLTRAPAHVHQNALNAAEDGQAGLQDFGGSATLLFYQSEEGSEGRNAFVEKRRPDFTKFKRYP